MYDQMISYTQLPIFTGAIKVDHDRGWSYLAIADSCYQSGSYNHPLNHHGGFIPYHHLALSHMIHFQTDEIHLHLTALNGSVVHVYLDVVRQPPLRAYMAMKGSEVSCPTLNSGL